MQACIGPAQGNRVCETQGTKQSVDSSRTLDIARSACWAGMASSLRKTNVQTSTKYARVKCTLKTELGFWILTLAAQTREASPLDLLASPAGELAAPLLPVLRQSLSFENFDLPAAPRRYVPVKWGVSGPTGVAERLTVWQSSAVARGGGDTRGGSMNRDGASRGARRSMSSRTEPSAARMATSWDAFAGGDFRANATSHTRGSPSCRERRQRQSREQTSSLARAKLASCRSASSGRHGGQGASAGKETGGPKRTIVGAGGRRGRWMPRGRCREASGMVAPDK